MRIAALLFGLLVSVPAYGDTLIGNWTCTDENSEGHMISDVSFSRSGRFKGDMQIFFTENGVVFAKARAKYRANYKISDGYLEESPTSVRIRSFIADGVDIRRGIEAKQLKQRLLKPGVGPKIVFRSPVSVDLVREDGTAISCLRKGTTLPTS
ncbi:hypothetical protein EBB79_12480 [Parasedimentitalea marina]|uniref:DUF2147 domain-containing protein n=1 Tax=Parasedimentitalea marina TaxID=2483033 RepID=A0A3T0N3K5_9RHOB|nr:hypothetical protein [Parasedimentitalea marina]AZV78608.1 hypothetical protein EBB79_12480 [Parasedimentitalea marina]